MTISWKGQVTEWLLTIEAEALAREHLESNEVYAERDWSSEPDFFVKQKDQALIEHAQGGTLEETLVSSKKIKETFEPTLQQARKRLRFGIYATLACNVASDMIPSYLKAVLNFAALGIFGAIISKNISSLSTINNHARIVEILEAYQRDTYAKSLTKTL